MQTGRTKGERTSYVIKNIFFEIYSNILLTIFGYLVNLSHLSLLLWYRFILHRLSQTFPNMPIFALVDWLSPFLCWSILTHIPSTISNKIDFPIFRNPAGLAILCTYKYGSISMGLESYRYGMVLSLSYQTLMMLIPLNKTILFSMFSLQREMAWAKRGWSAAYPWECIQELKPRDLQIAKSLLSSKFLQVRIWLLNFLVLCWKLQL
jgi:hypothetical protein